MASSEHTGGRSTVSNVVSATHSPSLESVSRSGVPADIALPETASAVNAAAPVDTLDFNFWSNMHAALDAFDTSIPTSNNEEPLDQLSDVSIEQAPRIIQIFLSHGEACTRIEGEALELVSNKQRTRGEGCSYLHTLDFLERLQEKAVLLESAISRLAYQAEQQQQQQQDASEITDRDNVEPVDSKAAANANLRRVFSACLSVLRARKENLRVAQDLVDSAQENISISLGMEYLDMN